MPMARGAKGHPAILLAHMSLSTCLLTYQTVGFVRSRGRTLVRLLYVADVKFRSPESDTSNVKANAGPYLIKGPREYLSLSFHSNLTPISNLLGMDFSCV